jgi:peptidoglycan hydrolase CwlO-like protein
MALSTQLVIAAATIIAACISAAVAISNQNKTAKQVYESNRLDHDEALLGAYSQMVDDLKGEVDRLKEVITTLREEQEDCDRRNKELKERVNNLSFRLSQLEGK